MRKTEKPKPEDEPAPGEPPTGVGEGGEEKIDVGTREPRAPSEPDTVIVAGNVAGVDIAGETSPPDGVSSAEVKLINAPSTTGLDAEPRRTGPLPPLPLGW